jgi:hypothetical protein
MAQPFTSSNTVHVVPPGDLVGHETDTDDPTCVCGPRHEAVFDQEIGSCDGWLIIHHSLDAREL